MFKFAMFKFPKLHFVTLLLGAVVSFLVNAVALPSFQVRAWSQLSNVQTPIQSSGETAPEEFRPEVVVARALPALKNIAARPVSDANMILRDDELVLGVEVGGRARAYPINMLTGPTREIINEELNGVSIAATW